MMNKIALIVVNSYSIATPIKYKIERFKQELKLFGFDIEIKTSIDLNIFFSNYTYESHLDLSKYKFCLFFDKDEICASMLENYMPVFNSSFSLINCNNKIKTFLYLKDKNVRMPKTIVAPLCYQETFNKETFNNFINLIEKELEFPLICKCAYGSLGMQVYLINNHEELISKYKELIYTPHLYQEYIKESKGMDYRILTVNNKVVAYMKRENKNDFRSNIALGGKGYFIKPPESFLQTAINASKALKLDYGGIDLLIGKDGNPYIAEINSNPFFSEIEKISNINITRIICQHIIDKVK